MRNRKLLGEILVETGIINDKTVTRLLSRAKRFNKKLGTILVETELLSPEELVNALAIQFDCKVVSNFASNTVPSELKNIIPVDLAMENMLFPLKIEGNRLSLAMADPTNMRIVSNIASNHGLEVIPFVATRNDIYAAVSMNYQCRDLSNQRQRTVLIVEDDELIATMLRDILTSEDYHAVITANGMEGYRQAISESPQVILTDKIMPKLDGYGLFNALQNIPETRLIPVILMTSRTEPEEEELAFQKGFFDFLTKPIHAVTLKTRVKRAFQFYEHQYGFEQ